MFGDPAHPSELADPCCIPALGEFTRFTPHGVLQDTLAHAAYRHPSITPHLEFGVFKHRRVQSLRNTTPPAFCFLEDSTSGLCRTPGTRVGSNPSGVQIPYPPPQGPHRATARRGPSPYAAVGRPRIGQSDFRTIGSNPTFLGMQTHIYGGSFLSARCGRRIS